MPTTLTPERHLAGLHEAMLRFARHAADAGLDVPVPTCPDWTVRRLIGHQGAVHRWAAATLRGREVDRPAVEKAGRSHADPVEWLRDGAIELVGALVKAPDDLEAPVFLLDAPPPRRFWARRQCHETTMHAVDAQAAALGRLPAPEETGIAHDVAVDGLDEQLLGRIPLPASRMRSPEPVHLAVHVLDADHSYAVAVSDEPPVVVRHDGATTAPGDRVAAASALELYLAVWHRTPPTPATAALWPLWHDSAV